MCEAAIWAANWEVDSNTVISLEVSHFLTFTDSNMFRTALLELWLIPPSTHISLL